jgi:hypothetical protein
MNFLNCPAFFYNSNEECKEIKKFVANNDVCGKHHGEVFVINYRYWHQEEGVMDETTSHEHGLTTGEPMNNELQE